MITEALKYFASLANASVKPERVEIGDPAKVVFLVGDKEVHIDRPFPSRSHKADDLETIVSMANRFAAGEPSIWVDDDNVVLVIDESEYRADRVRLDLETTDVWGTIEGLKGSGSWFEQRALLRLLRVDLAGAIPSLSLADKVKKVRFENSQVTTGEKTRDRESLGREINSRVDAGVDLPEEVELVAAVYRVGQKFSIRCSFEADPARGMFQLIPFPDEVSRVRNLAVMQIIEAISEDIEEGVEVYRGIP